METKFLKQSWKTLKEFISNHFGAGTLDESDTIGRYLTSSSHFSEEKKRVKHNALMPMKNNSSGDFETSVFNISGLHSHHIESLANKHILPNLRSGRSIYGTGDTNKKHIDNVGLIAQISEPPKKHINIIGWPDEKSKQKLMAMELASECKLSLFADPIKK